MVDDLLNMGVQTPTKPCALVLESQSQSLTLLTFDIYLECGTHRSQVNLASIPEGSSSEQLKDHRRTHSDMESMRPCTPSSTEQCSPSINYKRRGSAQLHAM